MTNKAIGVMGKQDYEIGCEYVIEYNKTVDRNNSTRSDPNKVPEFNENQHLIGNLKTEQNDS